MKTIHAAAGIVRHGGDVLAVQRGYGEMAGLWEFPGGKIERGETAAQACARELREELQVEVRELRAFYTVEYDYPEFHLEMECFFCELAEDGNECTDENAAPATAPETSPSPAEEAPATSSTSENVPPLPKPALEPREFSACDHQLDIRWIPRRSLADFAWMPADVELVQALQAGTDAPEQDEALVKRRRDGRKSMQGNKRANTKPELLVRQRLREAGLPGYRLQWKKAPGRPDIAYPGRKVAIFVNGCYWHRCPHCQPPVPKRNRAFWEAKFERNVARDEQALAELEELGWTAIVIWECELKRGRIDETMDRVIAQVKAAKTRR